MIEKKWDVQIQQSGICDLGPSFAPPVDLLGITEGTASVLRFFSALVLHHPSS